MNTAFDPQKALAGAAHLAASQEEQTRQLLWQHIQHKAVVDRTFREQLAENPREVVASEAEQMVDPSGHKVQIGTAVVEKIAEQAEETFSSVVPEIAAKRVEQLIFGTIEDIRTSFKITLLLSQVLFYSGLLMTIAAFVAGLSGGEKMTALLFGAGGVGSMLISSLVLSPLDRVQNAAGNLVQLQMAYLAYYKQLYLLGGTGGKSLAKDDAVGYAREIDRAAISLISSVQTYIERNGSSRVADADTNKEPRRGRRSAGLPSDTEAGVKKP